MSAHDHLSPVQFYHGTHAQLSPGDYIEPGHPGNFDASSPEHVYFTPHVESARNYAFSLGAFREPPSEHTYEVETTGEHELDPEAIGSFVPPSLKDARRSRSPLRVVREV